MAVRTGGISLDQWKSQIRFKGMSARLISAMRQPGDEAVRWVMEEYKKHLLRDKYRSLRYSASKAAVECGNAAALRAFLTAFGHDYGDDTDGDAAGVMVLVACALARRDMPVLAAIGDYYPDRMFGSARNTVIRGVLDAGLTDGFSGLLTDLLARRCGAGTVETFELIAERIPSLDSVRGAEFLTASLAVMEKLPIEDRKAVRANVLPDALARAIGDGRRDLCDILVSAGISGGKSAFDAALRTESLPFIHYLCCAQKEPFSLRADDAESVAALLADAADKDDYRALAELAGVIVSAADAKRAEEIKAERRRQAGGRYTCIADDILVDSVEVPGMGRLRNIFNFTLRQQTTVVTAGKAVSSTVRDFDTLADPRTIMQMREQLIVCGGNPPPEETALNKPRLSAQLRQTG